MTNVHRKPLAAYMDLGSIYSYGYGAMRSRYQLFHDNLCEAEDLLQVLEDVISAVEFRSAEIQASHLLGMDQLSRDCGQQPYVPIPDDTSAIYQAPAGADGIARDQ
jgi:hypothetical protein